MVRKTVSHREKSREGIDARQATIAGMRELVGCLGEHRVERDVPLAPHTTFNIGGPADLFYRASSRDEVIAAITAARKLDIPCFLLGMGANILVGDRGFRGLVIKNEAKKIFFLDETRVQAESGVRIYHDLIQAAVSRGLGGLHHFVGIPSTVGGAVWQNLHFLSAPPGRERTMFIAEIVEGATVLTEEGAVRAVDRDYFKFGYDHSVLHDRRDIVLDVTFRLEPRPREELQYVISENLKWRDDHHPDLWLYPSAGSIFKKIEGVGAGRLIDQCGLKGRILGGAQIFHKHANIIVNLGGATAADVRALIDLAQSTVKRELGHELTPEIGFIGEGWGDMHA